jgi:hypothetical protein
MDHPSPEQWMEYLYEESEGGARRELSQHLESCAACQAKIAGWRGAMRELDRWRVESAVSPSRTLYGILRWAAAALLLLGMGYLVGRVSRTAPPDMGKLRREVAAEVRTSLEETIRREMLASFNTSLAATQKQLQDQMAEAADASVRTSYGLAVRLIQGYATTSEDYHNRESGAMLRLLSRMDEQEQRERDTLANGLSALAVQTDEGFARIQGAVAGLAELRSDSGRAAQHIPGISNERREQ